MNIKANMRVDFDSIKNTSTVATGRNISGNIDIQASFSGQMPWSFYFVTIFCQTDADIFFGIIASERFHISEILLLRCTEG